MPIPPPLAHEDPSVFEGMISGKPYHYRDPYVQRVASIGRAQMHALNAELDEAKRDQLVKETFSLEEGAQVGWGPDCFWEYGFNIHLGDDVAVGPRCVFLDVCPIYIGARTMLGPSVSIYTPVHPLLPEARNGTAGKEAAKPISIGTDCWLGGSCVILPGVKIGNGVTVGAGSVVTKDVADRSVVVGNPARVVKALGEAKEDDLEAWR